jgi:hypothetical protein
MDVIRFLCVSPSSSRVQLQDSLGSRHACTCSEAGCSSQNGNCSWGVYYQRAVFCCVFCGQKDSMERLFIKKCFLFMLGSVSRVKQFTTGLRRNSQGRLRVAGDAQSGRSVEIATEATVELVEELSRADTRITIDSVAAALRCPHGLAYSVMHDHLKFQCARGGYPENCRQWSQLPSKRRQCMP